MKKRYNILIKFFNDLAFDYDIKDIYIMFTLSKYFIRKKLSGCLFQNSFWVSLGERNKQVHADCRLQRLKTEHIAP